MADETIASRPQRRGLYFEDYHLGQIFESGARTLTEADVVAFTGVSWDTNPLHNDDTFARRTAFRGRIAHGMLLNAVASGLAAQMGIFDGTVAAFAHVNAQFVRPVPLGDTVHVRLEVIGVDEAPKRRRGRIHFATQMFNQDGAVVAEGDWGMVFLRRKPGTDA